jgi:hypothetical protein
LPEPYKLVPVGIVTLKNRTPTPMAQLFTKCAREVAKSLATGKSIRHGVARLKKSELGVSGCGHQR